VARGGHSVYDVIGHRQLGRLRHVSIRTIEHPGVRVDAVRGRVKAGSNSFTASCPRILLPNL
jgi:hypothetical protein